MSLPELTGRRTVGVRLTDIDIKIRRRRGRALYEAAVADRDIRLAMEIDSAIERPSEKVYWLPAGAVEKVLGE